MSIKLNANRLQLKLSLFTDQTLYFLDLRSPSSEGDKILTTGDLLTAGAKRYICFRKERKEKLNKRLCTG